MSVERLRGASWLAALVAAASAAGCGDGYEVVIRFASASLLDDAAGIEIDLTRSCGELPTPWAEPTGALRSLAFPPTESPPRLGRVRPGTYALRARVRDEYCVVTAGGCSSVELRPFGEGVLTVWADAVEDGPGCGPGERCLAGQCVDGGEVDADVEVDAEAEVDADVEVDADPDEEPDCDVAPGWTRAIGGVAIPWPRVALSQDGTVLLLANVSGDLPEPTDLDPGPGVVPFEPPGPVSLFVVALDSGGSYLWSQTIDGAGGWFQGEGITVMDDGDVVIVGHFDETVDLDPGPGVDLHSADGLSASFVMAFAPDGELRWVRTMGSTGHNWAMAVDAAGSDRLVVAGFFTGTADLDPGVDVEEHVAVEERDGFVCLLDGEGELLWARVLAGSRWEVAMSAVAFYDSSLAELRSVVVGGIFDGTVDLDPGSGVEEHDKPGVGQFALFVAKLDAAGDHVWSWAVGGDHADDTALLLDMAPAPGEDLVIAGDYEGAFDLYPGEPEDLHYSVEGTVDVFALRVNSSGARQRGLVLGGAEDDHLQGVAVTADGSMLLAGTAGIGFDLDPGEGEDLVDTTDYGDAYLIMLNLAASYVWGRTLGRGIFPETGAAVAVSDDDWIVLAGVYYDERVDFDFRPECEALMPPPMAPSMYVMRLGGGGYLDQ